MSHVINRETNKIWKKSRQCQGRKLLILCKVIREGFIGKETSEQRLKRVKEKTMWIFEGQPSKQIKQQVQILWKREGACVFKNSLEASVKQRHERKTHRRYSQRTKKGPDQVGPSRLLQDFSFYSKWDWKPLNDFKWRSALIWFLQSSVWLPFQNRL